MANTVSSIGIPNKRIGIKKDVIVIVLNPNNDIVAIMNP